MPCSLLAQLPTADPAQLGSWLIVFAAVLGLIYLGLQVAKICRDLWWPASQALLQLQPAQPAYVPAGEFAKLEHYTHQSVHELRTQLHAVSLRIEVMRREISQEIEAAVVRLELKVDGHSEKLSRLLALVEQGFGARPLREGGSP